MNIENILKIKNLSIDQYFEKRFKFYKKKYGSNLQKYQFLNMIKNEPEETQLEAEKMKKEFGLFGNPTEKNLTDIIKVHTDYIFSETNNALLAYEKKYNRIISKVIFTGGGALLKGLPEVAATNFRAEIQIGRPFSKVAAPEFLDKVLETLGPEFAVAIGLALRKLQ